MAKEYVRSLEDAPRDIIKIIYPSYGETLYSHSTDPYIKIDLLLSSQIEPRENYQVQIFTMKDKVMSLPFHKKSFFKSIQPFHHK